jgi:2-polyprenyl-3-methyl-5-hydroxy-6-metoxy-1,4-benzoquinol methylase
MRPCPYCDAVDGRVLGERNGSTYRRCSRCRSIYKEISATDYAQLHANAFTDDEFLDNIVSAHLHQPDRATWRWLEPMLPPGPVLEIGPGSGHLLAAARESGREVYGVEASKHHRDFISRTWSIETVRGSLDDLPRSQSFSAVVAVNTIEHVYDVGGLLRGIRSKVAPGGAVFFSTCNAEYVLLPLIGMSWTMFKVPDHVSIPSAEGFRRLASRTGFTCRRTWTGELPLETPIAVAAAARDWVRERRGVHADMEANGAGHAAAAGASPAVQAPLDRRLKRKLMAVARYTDPIRHMNALAGRAAAIRGLFVPAS